METPVYQIIWATNMAFKVGGNDIVCENSPSTCRRSLCECDKMFAKMQAANYDKFSSDFSIQLSDWEPEDKCIRGQQNTKPNPKCCGGETMPFYVTIQTSKNVAGMEM